MRRDDEDDRSGDAGKADGDASWAARIVIPDDISELDAEVRALQRERRAARRGQRLRRLVTPGRTSGPLLLVAVLLVAGVAGLMVLFQPRRTGNVATIGGSASSSDRLLPDVLVRLMDGTSRRVRDYRPAVLALAPVGCRCDAALRDVGLAADEHHVSFLLVDRTLPSLPAGLTDPTAIRLVEPTGELAVRYGAEADGRRVAGGPVLVLVGAGGQVVRVLPEASLRTLDLELSGLTAKAAAAT